MVLFLKFHTGPLPKRHVLCLHPLSESRVPVLALILPIFWSHLWWVAILRGCDLNLATFHPCDCEGEDEWPVFWLGGIYKVMVELAHLAVPCSFSLEY